MSTLIDHILIGLSFISLYHKGQFLSLWIFRGEVLSVVDCSIFEYAFPSHVQAAEQEQEDLEAGDGIIYHRVFKALSIAGKGDKIRLPPSSFEQLSSQSAIDKGPMFFEVSAVHPPSRLSTGCSAASLHTEEVKYLFEALINYLRFALIIVLQGFQNLSYCDRHTSVCFELSEI